ncbi:hypothetical protein THASP1DRAFT_14015 [Thamnocephalis sphaerospora]|uniref:Oxysterol-binding protein n=1 Tax=Thamnocephalis sphaerospora TaxID=78915 RepID=A0A4P9XTU1_9FUNG|nr:hypothetical protein THASP1DRAFT_14015 [Thamnocephalis sphaerospora]|eukprot:RKP09614.1 hypothetical protein THASP1DRAFT_14015 [Thamnocephalis sphaerospora]
MTFLPTGRSGSTTVVMSNNDIDSECTEVIPDESRSILLGIISQLSKGVDLHRVTLPTFVLEPRSFLERITDFMSHPELILGTAQVEDPVERFVQVTRYFLSGWHIQPKGVKKPYNPVIGEFFRCQWEYANKTRAVFVSEQVSHHPPVSAYYYASPENNLVIRGQIYPKSKFLGNSVASLMQGGSVIEFTNRPGEQYTIAMPNIYARGILFGTMVMELGDVAVVRCHKTGLVCEIEFKTKGFFTGTYNAISGKVKREATGETLYEITGKWSDRLFIKKSGRSEEPTVFFDARQAKIHPLVVPPVEEQEPFESRRKWRKVTRALMKRDMDEATDEKTAIEDEQRRSTKEREADGVEWQSRFFYQADDDRWLCRIRQYVAASSGDCGASPRAAC